MLAPPTELVKAFLRDTGSGWSRFREGYLATLEERFASDRSHFEALAERARVQDVFLGCNCPTRKQPRVDHCHTVLALQFMAQKYPDLDIVLPD